MRSARGSVEKDTEASRGDASVDPRRTFRRDPPLLPVESQLRPLCGPFCELISWGAGETHGTRTGHSRFLAASCRLGPGTRASSPDLQPPEATASGLRVGESVI